MTGVIDTTTFDPALAMARQALYRFAALTLLDPKVGSWQRLRSLRDDPILPNAVAFLRGMPESVANDLALGERPLTDLDPAGVLLRLPESDKESNEHYEAIFGLLVSNACPPYETEYIDSKFTFQRGNALADISGFYRAFGVTTSQRHPERPDHIVQELEFMALLIGLSRQADQMESPLREDRLNVCRAGQARFLREHLTWWAPAFTCLLAREGSGGFYERAAAFLAALVAIERALFRIPIPNARPAPSTLEQPDSCDGCLIRG